MKIELVKKGDNYAVRQTLFKFLHWYWISGYSDNAWYLWKIEWTTKKEATKQYYQLITEQTKNLYLDKIEVIKSTTIP